MYGVKVDESRESVNPFIMATPDEVATRIFRILEGQPMFLLPKTIEQIEAPRKTQQ